MSITRKIISIVLSICLVVSVFAVGIVPTAAANNYETYAQDTIQGSTILHCFNWTYNNIKSALPDIAKAGYTAVQTSPVQRPKDYNSTWTDTSGQWWKMYQPLGLSISDGNTWLGTKAELTSLCTEAEKYDIKVVVDIVANHLANNGTDGGTYSYVNSGIESDLKNSNYFHTNNTRTNDDSRYNITQYHLGMPDLNTGNSYVQQRALGLLKECIDCGVDGFRFDAAKHIETPTDVSSFRSNFWPTVINGATSYSQSKGVDTPFYYGEILGNAGPNFGVSNYTTYMAVTDNYTGDRALDKTYYQWAPELADATYYKGASADKSVLWVESHDTYMGSSGSAGFSSTRDIQSEVIQRAWAIVGARADSTALYFARPNSTMGAQSSDNTWKSSTVAEVNKFKNYFNGTSEYIANSGNTIAYVQRGTTGIVISKLDGSGDVSISSTTMENGTYKDQITGNNFTVSNGVISGTVGSVGVAVVYNAEDPVYDYIENDTLYLKPNSNWTQASARFAMYVYNAATGANTWVNMTDSDEDGYYSADVPSGDWTHVIFCRMNPSSSTNSFDEGVLWNQTNNLFPDDNTDCYEVAAGAWSNGDGTWTAYDQQETTESADDPNTYTIYAINNADNWNKVNVYWWGSSTNCSWPGTEMNSYSGNKVYTYNVPNDVTGILFTNGASSNTKQSVDITSGITDGAVFTINNAESGGKKTITAAPTYYLVGTMTDWNHNDNYKFSIVSSDSGKLEYKLSGVGLNAGVEVKVHSSSETWYPGGNNHTVTAAGTYDIYFRPNGDGDSTWLSDSSNSSKRYIKIVNVTPYTITWKDGDGNTLKTDTVTYGETPSYSGDTPTKTATAQYTYTFNNTWSPPIEAATADATYTAQFTETTNEYTVTWKNYDGTTLGTDTVAYGELPPAYTGETPTKAYDNDRHYLFIGWDNASMPVYGDVICTAQFVPYSHSYTDTWDWEYPVCEAYVLGTADENDVITTLTLTCSCGRTETHVIHANDEEVEWDQKTPSCTETVVSTFTATYVANNVAYIDEDGYNVIFDPTGHTYDTENPEWVWNFANNVDYSDPTCAGVSCQMVLHCKNCDNTTSINAAVTYSANEYQAATCTANGKAEYVAAAQYDGHYYSETETKTILSEGHNMEFHPAANPTCTAEGNSAYWSCDRCGKFFYDAQGLSEAPEDSWIIPQSEHIWDLENGQWYWDGFENFDVNDPYNTYGNIHSEFEVGCQNCDAVTQLQANVEFTRNIPASCDHTGEMVFTATLRDYPDYSDTHTIPLPINHGTLTHHAASAASCTEPGNVEYWQCESCGRFFGDENAQTQKTWDQIFISAAGHNTTYHPANASTCTTAGNSEYWECETCHKYFADAQGNNEIAENSWILPLAAHSYGEPVWTWSDDYRSASAEFTCSVCNDKQTANAPATETSGYLAPTCTEAGSVAHVATVTFNGLNYMGYKLENIPAAGHNTTFHPANAATCTEAGNSAYYSCDRCNKYFSDSDCRNEIAADSWIIEPLNHQYTYSARWNTDGLATYMASGDLDENTPIAYLDVFCGREDCPNHSQAIQTTPRLLGDVSIILENGNYEFTVCEQEDATTTTIHNAMFIYNGELYYLPQVDTVFVSTVVGHTNLSHHDAVLPTKNNTDSSGNILNGTGEYYTCDKCGKMFSDAQGENEIDAPEPIPYFEYDTIVVGGSTRYVITAYNGSDENVVIPAAIPANYPDQSLAGNYVDAIGNGTEPIGIRNNINSFTIPSGTNIYINNYAFKGAELTSFEIGGNVSEICDYAFEDCVDLQTVNVTGSVRQLDRGVFKNTGLDTFRVENYTGDIRYWGTGNDANPFAGASDDLTIYGKHVDISNNTFSGICELATRFNIDFVALDSHCYGEPTWDWADDFSSATATFTCMAGDDTQTVDAVILQPQYEPDRTVYTAKAEINGVEYTDTQYGDYKLFIGRSLTLGGDVGINFFLNLTAEQVANSYVSFSWADYEPVEAEIVFDNKRNMYVATCYVAVAEMSCDVTATVYTNGEAIGSKTDSVMNYAERLLSDSYKATYIDAQNKAGNNGAEKYSKLETLVKTMLDYGTRAQIRFDSFTDKYANGGDGTEFYYDVSSLTTDSDPSNMYAISEADYGLTYRGTSIIFLSKTTLRHYYIIEDNEKFEAHKAELMAHPNYSSMGNGIIYFDFKNIAAHDFDVKQQFTIAGTTYEYSVLDYIGKLLVSSQNDAAKNLGKNAIAYYQATQAFFQD